LGIAVVVNQPSAKIQSSARRVDVDVHIFDFHSDRALQCVSTDSRDVVIHVDGGGAQGVAGVALKATPLAVLLKL
jgi:hypothetical protein